MFAAVAAAAALSAACEQPAPPPPPPPEVYVTSVTQRDVPVYLELVGQAEGFQDVDIRARVERARAIQLERFRGRDIYCNAQMSARDLRKHCRVDAGAERLLESAMNKLGLSARAYTRILKVARTITDLDGGAEIGAPQVAEAIQYRPRQAVT